MDREILLDPSITELMNHWTWTFSPEYAVRPPRAQHPLLYLSRTIYAHRLALFLYRYRETQWYSKIEVVNWRASRRSSGPPVLHTPTMIEPAQVKLWALLQTLPTRIYTMSGNLLDLRSDNFYVTMLEPKPLPNLTEILG